MSTHPRLHRRRIGLVAVAMLAVIGLAAGCQMAPLPRTSHSPSGYLDSVEPSFLLDGPEPREVLKFMYGVPPWPWPGAAKVVVMRGWAVDWDRPTWPPVQVIPAVIQNGRLTWLEGGFAAGPRPDVDAAFPETRNLGGHGYVLLVPTIPNSTATVCVVALNLPDTPGDNTILGCQTVAT